MSSCSLAGRVNFGPLVQLKVWGKGKVNLTSPHFTSLPIPTPTPLRIHANASYAVCHTIAVLILYQGEESGVMCLSRYLELIRYGRRPLGRARWQSSS